jgi:hypothetical protein
MEVFSAIQFCVNGVVMCEKIIFSKNENVTKENYEVFHDETVHKNTIFVKPNSIINILNYGMNMRRLISC